MANIVDIWAETNAALTGDDSTPALTLTNTSTGGALRLNRSAAAANSTIALLQLAPASVASVAAIGLYNTSFVSAVSIVFAASANWAGMGALRVMKTDGTFGWIPILPDAVVTAAVVA